MVERCHRLYQRTLGALQSLRRRPRILVRRAVVELMAAFAEEGDPAERVRLFRLLLLLDQTQWDRRATQTARGD
jgi:hypothetical protein